MKGARPKPEAIAGGLTRAPAMPDTLPTSMSKVWQTTVADMLGRGLLATSMLPLVETYIGALWMARECRKCIEEHGILAMGGNGARKPNPALAGLAKANEAIARLGDDLGISAVSRNRPGIKAAEREAPNDDASKLGI